MLTGIMYFHLQNYFVLISICLNLSFLEVNKNITSHHASGLCLSQLDSISLSQKVDLHSLLHLICPSLISKIFSSMFIYSIVHVSWLAYRLWRSCMEYKRNVVWTTAKLKDKEIWISYLKYFKISLQISFVGYKHREHFNVCIQNKTSTKQWNQNLTRT